MSVCLCSLRFEIADHSIKPEYLSFMASNLADLDKSDASPKPEEISAVEAKIHPITEKKLNDCKGKRTFAEIVIETHLLAGPVFNKENGGKVSGSFGVDQGNSKPGISTKALAPTASSSKESSPAMTFEAGSASVSREHSQTPSDSEKRKSKEVIQFTSGNPFVEITQGILHLYKDNHLTSLEPFVPRSEMICILAIPATLTCQDLLQFIAPCRATMENLKIIKDNTPNQYMALLKFRSQEEADQFYTAFNGSAFNAFENNVCHLVYIARVEVQKSSEGASLPLGGCTELPTCPVCLERMDETVDGILTILCNHSFHAACLAQWEDTSCPVCRHVQTPEVATDNVCQTCGSIESLWICLICGHVGCGRYVGGHAYTHFLETYHCYAMQLGNSRVWDYVGDNFVHRLIASKSDGKMVELDDSRASDYLQEKHPSEPSGKMDSIQLEYSYLLTSQLEAQRGHFEEKIDLIESRFQEEREDLVKKAEKAITAAATLKEDVVTLTREKQTLERKVTQLSTKLSKAYQELQDEKELNRSLQENQATYQKRLLALEKKTSESSDHKDKAIADLQEQLRDLMFYIGAQDKIQKSDLRDEISDGQVVVPVAEPPSIPTPKKGSARKRKGQ